MRTARVPVTMGHECAGEVTATGAGVTLVRPGDRVVLESHLSCGHCHACLRGRAHLCGGTRYLGIDLDGGFAAHTVVPERLVWKVGPGMPYETAAMLEPFGVAVQGVTAGRGVAGSDVVVAGCGPIGVMTILAAKALGALRVIAVDLTESRLAAADQAGADCCLVAGGADVAEDIVGRTEGRGADVYIDSTGSAASLRVGEQSVAAGGEIRLLAAPGDGCAPDFDRWLHRGLVVRSLHGRRIHGTWVEATALVSAGRVDLGPLVTRVYPLEGALDALHEAREKRSMKLLIKPG
jgi:threonine 3-dehydrogenase